MPEDLVRYIMSFMWKCNACENYIEMRKSLDLRPSNHLCKLSGDQCGTNKITAFRFQNLINVLFNRYYLSNK